MAVGKPLPQKDAHLKVKGEVQYIYDLSFPDEQFLAVVRSPHAHARIMMTTQLRHKFPLS